jgi:hypothetical protein
VIEVVAMMKRKSGITRVVVPRNDGEADVRP